MMSARVLMAGFIRTRPMLTKVNNSVCVIRRYNHNDFPQPFDNMPFRATSRILTTLIFGVLFGTGLWAPYFIVWYSMARRSL